MKTKRNCYGLFGCAVVDLEFDAPIDVQGQPSDLTNPSGVIICRGVQERIILSPAYQP